MSETPPDFHISDDGSSNKLSRSSTIPRKMSQLESDSEYASSDCERYGSIVMHPDCSSLEGAEHEDHEHHEGRDQFTAGLAQVTRHPSLMHRPPSQNALRKTSSTELSSTHHHLQPPQATTLKSALKGTRSDACLNTKRLSGSASADHFNRSLSKSDLLALKRTVTKSDFRQVQDPLSRSKLKKNNSLDCPPGHDPIFRIGGLLPEDKDYGTRICDCTDSEEGDLSQPSALFPSMRFFLRDRFRYSASCYEHDKKHISSISYEQ